MADLRLGHFRILEKLGAGGMGVVFRGHDEDLGRDVAIKVLHADSLQDSAARSRLLREARTASKLNHPNICTIHEVGESEGQAYIAMELVEGQTLSSRLESGALPVEEVLRYGAQLAEALTHAHERGVIHRDLKSANIIITGDQRAKVLDFGLAKHLAGSGTADAPTVTLDTLTLPGMITGTLAYMSPEQLRGEVADARSDIWALGVILYEMVADQRPFQGHTGFELSSAILGKAPEPLSEGVPEGLRDVIGRCLEKDPGLRFQHSQEVLRALESLKSGVALPESAHPPRALPRWSWKVWPSLAVGSVLLLVILTAGWALGFPRWGLGTPLRSLAVLPVANLSGNPEQEYFTDGMTDALITDLSKIGALKVISLTSVMRYKGTKKALSEIARELNVDTVLEASVVREADQVRVSVNLLDAMTDRSLWAESYERELSSVLALQGEVARAVARAVNLKLRPEEAARLSSARKVNPATYEAYLRGMYFIRKGTPDGLRTGMAFLQGAVEKDPADPLAYAGLALGYITIAHGADPTDDAMPRAKVAAQTALRLDATMAETLAASAFVEGYYGWNWSEADRLIQRALEINPSLASAHFHRAWFDAAFDRMPEAIAAHRRAQEFDPFDPSNTAWLGELYRWEGRLGEAEMEARKAIAMAPEFPAGYLVLSLVHLDRGQREQAIDAMKQAAKADPDWRWALGMVYAATGRETEARKLLEELKTQKVIPWVACWRIILHASLGEMDEAFRWFDHPRKHAWLPWFGVMPWPGVKALQKDPRMAERLRLMNLPPAKPKPA
jgi:serine/threonine protein kinase/tetratricopeptide (TPR) repeat protein